MLRNELRDDVDELLSPGAEIVRRGLVQVQAARQRFAAFLSSSSRLTQGVPSRDIFQLISLELWLRAYKDNLAG